MMRRFVRLFLLVISLFQTRIDTNAFGLGSAPASGAGDRALAIVNFRERELGKNAAARAPQPGRACARSPRVVAASSAVGRTRPVASSVEAFHIAFWARRQSAVACIFSFPSEIYLSRQWRSDLRQGRRKTVPWLKQ